MINQSPLDFKELDPSEDKLMCNQNDPFSNNSQPKKLGAFSTYLTLLKGFIALGILYMPKYCYNGGWLFSLITMLLSFALTNFAISMLLQARKHSSESTYSGLANQALGKNGKVMVDIFLVLVQFSFVYFVLESMKSVVDEVFKADIDV